jgi:pyrroline-5-carboxylate reductase
MPSDTAAPDPQAPPPELNKAGKMLEPVIEEMFRQNIPPPVIASALFGATLHILANSLPEEQIVRILTNAVEGVRAGHLRQMQR